MPPNYDPNSDDYHYPPRHEPAPDAEIDRLRAELADAREDCANARSSLRETEEELAATVLDLTAANARNAELEEVPPDLNGCIVMTGQEYDRIRARAEQAEAERDALREASPAERSRAIDDVVAERRRQIDGEGWTIEHDDGHAGGELASAAVCYALGQYLQYWPWDEKWWKPRDRRSNLVRAAALLIAEIERIDRMPSPAGREG